MCFHIHPLHRELKTAKKDIVCYKVLRQAGKNRYTSIHFDKEWRINRYKTFLADTKTFKVNWHGQIDEGLHSYSNVKKAYRDTKWTSRKALQFIIPKGQQYYYNPNKKEYVSLKLKFIKIMNLPQHF